MTPNVPLRVEMRFELPGTSEQVWQAIATATGLSSWSMPTELDERPGGEMVVHMGETESRGRVSDWEPPRRLVIEEPEWAALAGHEGAVVSPLLTEYLVEADSGGTCVLRVVSSAFGTGAEWEGEFLDDMERYWAPMFEHLRLYLNHFPGQQATLIEAGTELKGTPTAVIAAMRAELGASAVGDEVDLHGATGEVERLFDIGLLVRLTDPALGFVSLYSFPTGDGVAYAGVRGYLFGDAAILAGAHQRAWRVWFDRLPATVSADGP